MPEQVLLCKCGACSHWEIMKKEDKHYLHCMTCEKEFEVTLHVSHPQHLEWAGLEAKRKPAHESAGA